MIKEKKWNNIQKHRELINTSKSWLIGKNIKWLANIIKIKLENV